MSIIPVSRFPGQIAPISDNYPNGSAVNVTAPSAGDGTPLVESWMNDIWGFAYRMLRETGAIPNDVVDTTKVSQFFDALVQIAQAGQRKSYVENDVGSPNSKIIAKAGVEWDSTNQIPIALLADLKKDITLPWVAGDDTGGYASAAPLAADTWYHVFLIKSTENQAPGIVDVAIDASITATQALSVSGYTHYERIGSILTDGLSNILPFFVFPLPNGGRKIIWKKRIEISIPVPAGGAIVDGILQAINSPPDIEVDAIISNSFGFGAYTPTANAGLIRAAVYSPSIISLLGSIADTNRTATIMIPASTAIGVEASPSSTISNVTTNVSSQIRYSISNDAGLPSANIFYKLSVFGWYE